MNGWAIMNAAAWALSGILFLIIAWDFVKVELARRAERRGAAGTEDSER